MIVGLSQFEIHIPGARSLKDKRRVVRSLMERLHNRYRISIAETDFHDLHQRAEIGLAVVGRSNSEVDRLLEDLHRAIEGNLDLVITHWAPEILEGQ